MGVSQGLGHLGLLIQGASGLSKWVAIVLAIVFLLAVLDGVATVISNYYVHIDTVEMNAETSAE